MKIKTFIAVAVFLTLSAGTSSAGNNPEGMPPKEKEVYGFVFDAPRCSIYPSKKTVECTMMIANRGRTRSLYLSTGNMKIVDNYENDYTPVRMVLERDVGAMYVSFLFESDEAHELGMTFQNVAARASLLKTFRANFSVRDPKTLKTEAVVVEFKNFFLFNTEEPPPPPPPVQEGSSLR